MLIDFFYPWWLFFLPLAVLPWLWPEHWSNDNKYTLFSTFLLFPKSRQSIDSLKNNWVLKVLRSLVIFFLCLLFSTPFWRSEPTYKELTIIDDSLSALAFSPKISVGESTYGFSSFFPESSIKPWLTSLEDEPYWGSAGLGKLQQK